MPLDLPALKSLNTKSIVLASASPRRREILSDMVRPHIRLPLHNVYFNNNV